MPEINAACPFGLRFGLEIDVDPVCNVCPENTRQACVVEYERLRNVRRDEHEEIASEPEEVRWQEKVTSMGADEWQSYKREQYRYIAEMIADVQKTVSTVLNKIDKAEQLRSKSGKLKL